MPIKLLELNGERKKRKGVRAWKRGGVGIGKGKGGREGNKEIEG